MGVKLKLRNYQSASIEAVFEEWKEQQSTLIVLPTGGGKTVVFCEIVKQSLPKRSLILAHRSELIFQAVDKLKNFGIEAEIEMADYRASSSLWNRSPVVVASVQTLMNEDRMKRFNPKDFHRVIVDEGHHATAQSYTKILDYFKTNPELRILGVTATPDRADEQALGQVFKSVAYDYEILDAITDGWLVPITQQMVEIEGLDFSAVRTTAGDLNNGDLAAIMEAEENLQGIASASLDIIKDKRTIIFTASVKQAEMLSEIFNRHRDNMADWVCGATSKDKRKEKLGAFSNGQTQVMVNCLDSLTEILTRRGWKGMNEFKKDDITATLNLDTNKIEWQPVSRVVRRNSTAPETMVCIRNQTLDIRVTDAHRMVTRTGKGKWRIREASRLVNKKSHYDLPVSGIEDGFIGVPLTSSQLEFLGLFASDGSLNKKRASIVICQAKIYQDNCLEIERILTECGFDFRKTDGGNHWVYGIPKGTIGGKLKRNGWGCLEEWLNKSLNIEGLNEMTPYQFERIIYGLWLGDGDKYHHRNNRRKKSGYRFCGVDWKLFDRVQAWAVVRGWAANLSIRPNTSCGKHPGSVLGHLSLRKRNYVQTNNHTIATSGGNPAKPEFPIGVEEVWCVTNQNGTIITRRNGKVVIMGQCGVLGEGFDCPEVEVVIQARPTKSRCLYSQQVGRATRPLAGVVDGPPTPAERRAAIAASLKPSCLVVDFVGNSGRHKLMTTADILGGKFSDEEIEMAEKKAKEKGAAVDMREELEQARLEIEERKRLDAARKAKIVGKATYKTRSINPFDVFEIDPERARGWDNGKRLTEKQTDLLKKQGIDPSTMQYGQAKQVLNELFRRWDGHLATLKQCNLLKKHGYDTKNMPMKQASQLITDLANNGWRRPSEPVQK